MRSVITEVIKNLRGILSWLAQAGKNLLKHETPPSMVHIDKVRGANFIISFGDINLTPLAVGVEFLYIFHFFRESCLDLNQINSKQNFKKCERT